MVAEFEPLIDKVWRHCEGTGSRGRTVTLKVKFNDFEVITRSRSVPVAVSIHGTRRSSGATAHDGLSTELFGLDRNARVLVSVARRFLMEWVATMSHELDSQDLGE